MIPGPTEFLNGYWICQACDWSPEPRAYDIRDLMGVGGCPQCGGWIYQWRPDGTLLAVEGKVFDAMHYPGLTPEERIQNAIKAAKRQGYCEAHTRGEITYRELSLRMGWLVPEPWWVKLWNWFWIGVHS